MDFHSQKKGGSKVTGHCKKVWTLQNGGPVAEAMPLTVGCSCQPAVFLFLSYSIAFLVNQSFGVCSLLARFGNKKYSDAATERKEKAETFSALICFDVKS